MVMTETRGQKAAPDPLAYSLKDAARVSALSRSRIYILLGTGELRGRKAGRRTLICAESLQAYLTALPAPDIRPAKLSK
jgi:excisionase family DNA binding protein